MPLDPETKALLIRKRIRAISDSLALKGAGDLVEETLKKIRAEQRALEADAALYWKRLRGQAPLDPGRAPPPAPRLAPTHRNPGTRH